MQRVLRVYTMYYSWSLLPNDGCFAAVWWNDQPFYFIYLTPQEQRACMVWEWLFLSHPHCTSEQVQHLPRLPERGC